MVHTGAAVAIFAVTCVLVSSRRIHWIPLGRPVAGMATTFAGNLTLLGSVANIIVAEGAREHHEPGFLEYLKFGALTTAATLAVGVVIL